MLTGKTILTKLEAAQLNPVTLAFVGDAVYSLYVRERLSLSGGGKVADFQRTAARVVSAQGQSAFVERLLPHFTEEEADIFRRGKNAKKATKSKSATHLEYNRSTGFEAVMGYLYLIGEEDRIRQLLALDDEESFQARAVEKPFKPSIH